VEILDETTARAALSPLTTLSLDELRQRRSEKWRTYPDDVLPLWVAEMDTLLAEPIRAVLSTTLAQGDTGYAHLGQLAEAYAEFSGRRFGWSPDPSLIRLVPDVMQGIVEVLRAVTSPGDGVVINPPVYPPFFSDIRHAGRRLVEVPLISDESGEYHLDLDGLERAFAAGARAYLICNPHNPTGSVFTRDALLAAAELTQRYGVRLVVDEIHAPLTYPGVRHVPFLSLAEGGSDSPPSQASAASAVARAFVLVSASKAWNLAGLKAALAIAGPEAAQDLARIPAEVRYGAGLFGVIATEAAVRDGEPWLDALLADLDGNRKLLARLLADELPEVRYRPPDATFLAWLDCRRLGLGDDPAATFLEHGRVAMNRGHDFGAPGRGFVRLNFATTPELVAEGVRRMAQALR
jgi:cystathionine beta-lyase